MAERGACQQTNRAMSHWFVAESAQCIRKQRPHTLTSRYSTTLGGHHCWLATVVLFPDNNNHPSHCRRCFVSPLQCMCCRCRSVFPPEQIQISGVPGTIDSSSLSKQEPDKGRANERTKVNQRARVCGGPGMMMLFVCERIAATRKRGERSGR